MQLQPKRHPGRVDRKAAAYASEIGELRGAGYTYEAIREALADVGIALSTSALRREMRRLRSPSRSAPAAAGLAPVAASPLAHSQAPPSSPVRRDGPKGREVAEAFFNANPSNQLLRTQETS